MAPVVKAATGPSSPARGRTCRSNRAQGQRQRPRSATGNVRREFGTSSRLRWLDEKGPQVGSSRPTTFSLGIPTEI
jgi:hypothetical protein